MCECLCFVSLPHSAVGLYSVIVAFSGLTHLFFF